jgi:serine/threonine protein kinase
MSPAPTTPLVDALRQSRLLGPAQTEEVARTLQARFPDPQALAGELTRRGWLTPYQADQLLRGRGHELLLGPYVLLGPLGEGGMGRVFKARHRERGDVVALKLLRQERLGNPEAVRRFEREARAAAALAHPNVVRALDAGRVAGTHLLVMEYVEGATDLGQWVKRHGPLPVPQACEYVRQAALGLQHAHERGLVHRDIKPANLLRTADGSLVKVLDLGLARLDRPAEEGEQGSALTQEGALLGTPDYIAPEQALESHAVDTRADLYSLGCTFYYLLTGRVPFPGGTLLQKLNRHQNQEAPAVEALRPEVPPGVAAVVRRLLAKRPEDRYRTPAELAAALAPVTSEGCGSPADEAVTLVQGGRAELGDTLTSACTHESQGGDTSVLAPPPRRRQRAGGWRLLLYGLGCVALLAGAVTLWSLWKPPARWAPGANGSGGPPPAVPPGKPRAEGVERWPHEVASLPAEGQVEAVAARLKEINPGFGGRLRHKIDGGVVTELQLPTDGVTDLSPVRALTGLRRLDCGGTRGKGRLADLSPLRGMRLTALVCSGTQVSDLAPLRGMPLRELNIWYTPVSDLSPLKGMELTVLGCGGTQVTDLSPLRGMPLRELNVWGTPVSDLSPLKGMGLTTLACNGTKVSALSPLRGMGLRKLACDHTPVADLSPLRGMPLQALDCESTQVSDLSPLRGMPLKELWCDFQAERDTEALRSIKTLEKVNGKPAQALWKEAAAKRPKRAP